MALNYRILCLILVLLTTVSIGHNSLNQRSATFSQARATRWQNKLKAGRTCDINPRSELLGLISQVPLVYLQPWLFYIYLFYLLFFILFTKVHLQHIHTLTYTKSYGNILIYMPITGKHNIDNKDARLPLSC